LDYRSQSPQLLKDFLQYHENILDHSRATIDEYFLDLRNFFRYLKIHREIVSTTTPLDEISILDVDLDFVRKVTLNEVYDYLSWLSRDKEKFTKARSEEYGLSAASRARKVAALRSFYKYLTVKVHLLDENPIQDLETPKSKKALPRYLTLEESQRLLACVDGRYKERDYCILCIFLNCGLRISEICGLNISDIRQDHIRVLGKGNKERIVYLNDATCDAINNYLLRRKLIKTEDHSALFLSARKTRMAREGVHAMVKKALLTAGLDASQYSAHKLRHTAATLMISQGVDVRTLQELLGHENLNTTQIYTHIDNAELRTAANANPLANFDPNKENEK